MLLVWQHPLVAVIIIMVAIEEVGRVEKKSNEVYFQEEV